MEEIETFTLRNNIKMKFRALFSSSTLDRAACAHNLSWNRDLFCSMLDAAFPETGHYTQGAQSFFEEVINLCFDLNKPNFEQNTDNSLNKICEEHIERTREDEASAIKLLGRSTGEASLHKLPFTSTLSTLLRLGAQSS